jgi:hypothetical protein
MVMEVIVGGKVATMIVGEITSKQKVLEVIRTVSLAVLVPLDQEIVTKTDHHTTHYAIL